MLGPQRPLPQRQGSPVESCRVHETPLCHVDCREIQQGLGETGALGADRVLEHRDGPLIELLSVRVPVMSVADRSHIVQIHRDHHVGGSKTSFIDAQRLPVQSFGLVVLAVRVIQRTQIGHAGRKFRMVRSQRFLPDRERTFVKPLGLRVMAPSGGKLAQVVELHSNTRMRGPERPLDNGECATVKLLGVGIALLTLVQHGEAVECFGDLRMVGSEPPLANGQRALVKLPGFVEPPLIAIDVAEIRQAHSHIRVLGAERALADGKCVLVKLARGLPLALILVQYAQIVQHQRGGITFRTERLLTDGKSAPIERLGFGVTRLHPINAGEIVKRSRDMLGRRNGFFPDRERTAKQGLSARVCAIGVIERGQIVHHDGDLRIIRPEHGFPQGQCATVEFLGFRITALGTVSCAQIAEAGSEAVVLRSQFFGYRQRSGEMFP